MLLENDEMIIDIEGIIVNMKVERLKTHYILEIYKKGKLSLEISINRLNVSNRLI